MPLSGSEEAKYRPMPKVIAIDIGGTRFRVGLYEGYSLRLRVLEQDTHHTGGRDWMLERLGTLTGQLLQQEGAAVKAIGISFGGPVNYALQTVTSVHTPGWNNFALTRWMEEKFKLPCRLDNDANAGALGEFRMGAGTGCHSILYLTLSTGIGSGMVIQNAVHRGKDSMAGELGHIPLSDLPVPCTCGNTGCLESLASGRAIARAAREEARQHPAQFGKLLERCHGDPARVEAKDVFAAAVEGESGSQQVVQNALYWLARALVTAIRILNPDRIVLGGGLTAAGGGLLDPLRQQMRQWWSDSFPYSTEIRLAGLGEYAPLTGAACLAVEQLAEGYMPTLCPDPSP